MLTRNHYSKQRIGDIPAAENPKDFLPLLYRDCPHRHQRFLCFQNLLKGKSTACYLYVQQMTTFHRTRWLIGVFFAFTLTFRGVASYLRLMYFYNQGSEIPVTREIPAIGIFSSSSLSASFQVSFGITLFCRFSTNWRLQSLHLYLGLPL